MTKSRIRTSTCHECNNASAGISARVALARAGGGTSNGVRRVRARQGFHRMETQAGSLAGTAQRKAGPSNCIDRQDRVPGWRPIGPDDSASARLVRTESWRENHGASRYQPLGSPADACASQRRKVFCVGQKQPLVGGSSKWCRARVWRICPLRQSRAKWIDFCWLVNAGAIARLKSNTAITISKPLPFRSLN